MKKPVVDYRKFSFKKLNTPEFSHLWLLTGWVVYFILFFLTEKFVPQESCRVMYTPSDDMIPFSEWFIIPYVSWYFLIIGSIIYFALYNPDGFKKLMMFWIIVQLSAMAIYIIFPSRQALRPEVFPRDNILTDAVKFLYSIDTDTNVCPSMHVSFSLAMVSVWLKEKSASRLCKSLILLFVALVIMSVSFIKQHSLIDTYAAFAQCAVTELIVYGKYWLRKLNKLFTINS